MRKSPSAKPQEEKELPTRGVGTGETPGAFNPARRHTIIKNKKVQVVEGEGERNDIGKKTKVFTCSTFNPINNEWCQAPTRRR